MMSNIHYGTNIYSAFSAQKQKARITRQLEFVNLDFVKFSFSLYVIIFLRCDNLSHFDETGK